MAVWSRGGAWVLPIPRFHFAMIINLASSRSLQIPHLLVAGYCVHLPQWAKDQPAYSPIQWCWIPCHASSRLNFSYAGGSTARYYSGQRRITPYLSTDPFHRPASMRSVRCPWSWTDGKSVPCSVNEAPLTGQSEHLHWVHSRPRSTGLTKHSRPCATRGSEPHGRYYYSTVSEMNFSCAIIKSTPRPIN